jgi:hypothetical protein
MLEQFARGLPSLVEWELSFEVAYTWYETRNDIPIIEVELRWVIGSLFRLPRWMGNSEPTCCCNKLTNTSPSFINRLTLKMELEGEKKRAKRFQALK